MFRRGNPCVLWPTQVRGKWIATGAAHLRDDGLGLSLRGETYVSTRQSMCALAAKDVG